MKGLSFHGIFCQERGKEKKGKGKGCLRLLFPCAARVLDFFTILYKDSIERGTNIQF
jgi:hypothetical protein